MIICQSILFSLYLIEQVMRNMRFLSTLIFTLLILPTAYSQTDSIQNTDSFRIQCLRLLDHRDLVEQVAFSPDGNYLVSAGWDEAVMVYHTDSAFNYHSHFFPHSGSITALNFSRDGKYLLSGGQDRKISVHAYDSSTDRFKPEKELMLHTGGISSLFFDPGMRFIFSASDAGLISIYDWNKKSEQKQIKHGIPVNGMALSLDRRSLFVADNSPVIKQYDAIKGVQIKTFEGHTDYVNSVAYSLDRKYLVSGSNDKTAIVWDLQKGKIHKKLEGHSWKVTCVDISPDCKYVITGSTDGTVKLWDIATGNLIRSFEDGGRNVRDVAFYRDGTLIAAGMHQESDDESYGAVVWTSGLSKPVPVRRDKSRSARPAQVPKAQAHPSTAPAAQGSKPAAPQKNRTVIKKTPEMEISVEDK